MKNWITPALALALASSGHIVAAQSGAMDKMDKPMAKTFSGCVAPGTAAGTFMLTHAMETKPMPKDAMAKDTMAKDAMAKDGMGMMLALDAKDIDFSKHVGHEVSITGTDMAMAMGKGDAMAKSDAMAKDSMGKPMSTLHATSLKMIKATCGM